MGGTWKNLLQMSLDIERNLVAAVADRPISGMAELRFKVALHRAFAAERKHPVNSMSEVLE